MPKFARRITQTSKKSYGMFAKAAGIAKGGRDLIHLELGQPVHDTPQHIKKAAIDALRAGQVHYSDFRASRSFARRLPLR
jgi:aspartate aminotransferase